MKLKRYLLSSIRNKGIAVFAFPLLLIVAFVLIYYPAKEKKSSYEKVNEQAKTLSQMLAFSVGAGLNDANFDLVETAFNWAKKDKNVIFISILDENNTSIIEYNPNKINFSKDNKSNLNEDDFLFNEEKINYKDKNFGKIFLGYSLEHVNNDIATGLYTSLTIVGLILIFGLTWVIIIFNKIAGSIVSLRNAARLASEGNLNTTIEKKSIDEIGDLSDAFSKMLSNIKDANYQLEMEKKSVEKKVEDATKESLEQKEYLSQNVKLLLVNMDRFSKGDLNVKLEIHNDDDIGKLFEGFNNTVETIKQTIMEILSSVNTT